MIDPVASFASWLEWLDSHDGRLDRRERGGQETDTDLLGTIPSAPGAEIFTVGDLRRLVAAARNGQRMSQLEAEIAQLRAAVDAEREACAALAETLVASSHCGVCEQGICRECDRARMIAAAIRARKE